MSSGLSRRAVVAAGLAAATTRSAGGQEVGLARPPRIGLIGLGNRSRAHLSAYAELGNVEVAALSDIQSNRMRAARRGPAQSAALYTDYRELIADKRVEAVAIAVPNYLHARMAIEAMRSGKDVLLEKPIGLTFEEALEVARVARQTGQVLAVGMQRHYFEPYRRIVEAVRSGELGTPYLFALNEYRGDWNPGTWRWADPQGGREVPWRHLRSLAGSSLLEFSVHSYGFLYEMIGTELTYCAATGGAVHWPERTTEDTIAVVAEFGGIRVQHAFCASAPGASWQLTIVGSRGSLQYDRQAAVLRTGGSDPRELDLGMSTSAGPSMEVRMYRDFFRAVRERSRPAVDADFAIAASKLAYAAWMSIDGRRIVTDADFSEP